MKVYGQLERAQIELLSADPAGGNLFKGRFWFNTSTNLAKYYDGTSIQVFGSLAAAADAVAASMTSTGTTSIAGTMTTANANTIGGKITTAADTIAGQMTSTGSNAIAAAMTSTGSNAIGASRTRSTGTTVGAGGVAISASSSSFSTTSTSLVDVTNLTVTITTSGRPVYLTLQSDGSNVGNIDVRANVSSTSVTGSLYLVRGVTTISLSTLSFNGISSNFWGISVPAGSVNFVDAVTAGTYTYKFQAVVAAGSAIFLNTCKLVAYEL